MQPSADSLPSAAAYPMLPLPVYRSLFLHSPVGEYLLSRDFTILDVNDTFLTVSARRREDLVGANLFDVFPDDPDDPGSGAVAALRASLHRVLATGKPDALALQRYPIPVTGPDGQRRFEERFWSALNTPLFDTQGDLVCIAHSTIDVTALHAPRPPATAAATAQPRMEADLFTRAQIVQEVNRALQTERERLHHLFEHAPGFVCFTHGPDHVVEQANNAFAELVGGRQVAGLRLREALPRAGIHGFLEQMDEVFTTGRPHISQARRVSLGGTLGKPHDERFVDLVFQPIMDEDGAVTGICAQGVDITDKMRAEAQLRASARRQAFQLALADRLRALDAPQQIMAAAGEMLGRELDVARVLYGEVDGDGEVVHMRRDWTHPQHGLPSVAGERRHTEEFGPGVVALLRSGQTLRVQDVTRDPLTAAHAANYARLGVRADLAVALVKGGRMRAILALHHTQPRAWTDDEVQICRDAAERTWAAVEKAAAQAELHDANRRKDEFLAMLAHELRNPLAPISVAAQLMESGRLDPARLKQTSQVISRQVRHMTGLVDDLLDVSRVTRGLAVLDRKPQDMKAVVANAVEQVRPLIEAQRHHLAIDLAPEPAHVLGDAKRLVQIVSNLLNNAAKYTPPGGDVQLRMQVHGEQVELQVQDNGIGIAPDLQARVFDLFVQAERTSDRSQGGLGLGLALVRSLVELHGGSVDCHSDGLQQGSRFTVRLPLLPHAAQGVERRRHRREMEGAGAPLRILVVDDNQDAAQTLALLLETLGHAVTVAQDGREGLQAARREMPDVCLLDIGLPDIDGNELARRLRAQPETAGARLIAVTGYGQESDRRAALAAGFDEHMVKPVDPARLMAMLERIAARQLSSTP